MRRRRKNFQGKYYLYQKARENPDEKKNVKKKSNFCIAPKRPKIAFLERRKSTVKKAPPP